MKQTTLQFIQFHELEMQKEWKTFPCTENFVKNYHVENGGKMNTP